MSIDPFAPARVLIDSVDRRAETGPYPAALESVLSPQLMAEAQDEISAWPGYAPTPLVALDRLAADLNLAAIHYKDESRRFGLGSFKALGGAYAALQCLAAEIGRRNGRAPSLTDLRNGRCAAQVRDLTVITATDGNHGRSVAWGARMAGCRCRIYVHAEVSPGRHAAMEELGAEVLRIDSDYDGSLRLCAREAAENGWFVVSDTSYDGYMELPRHVMAGYSLMSREILDALDTAPPSHVFVQGGVGGLAAAVMAQMWNALGPARPRFVVVEPTRAACLLESARCDRPMAIEIGEETIMAGLSCGEVSLLAWEVLSRGTAHFLTIGESGVAPAMRRLASGTWGGGPIEAGESAVAGLLGLLAVCGDPARRAALGLDGDSRIVVIGSEGATDREIYRAIVAAESAGAAAGETRG